MPTNANITTGDLTKDWSAVRFGQTIDYETLRFIADRDPYGRLLVSGFVEQALGGRFDLMQADNPDEPEENNDEVWKVIKKQWKNFKKGRKMQRTWGEAFTCIFHSNNPLMEKTPFLKVFEPKDIDDENFLLYNDGSIQKLYVFEQEHMTGKQLTHKFEKNKEIQNVWHNIQETKEKYWEGRSYLEPVWDEIQGIRAIRMGCVLFAIRVGAGLRIIVLPEGTDSDIIADMKEAAQKWEAFNGFFVIPKEGAEVNIETGQGQINYEALKLVLLQSIAAYTNYPIAGFQGLEMERQAGEFQEEKVLDVSRVIQSDAEDELRWLIARFSEFYDWGYDEDSDYIIKWRGKEEISDQAQAQLDNLRATADATDINAGILSADEVRAKRGLTGSAPERPDMMRFSIKDDTDQEDDDEEEEDE